MRFRHTVWAALTACLALFSGLAAAAAPGFIPGEPPANPAAPHTLYLPMLTRQAGGASGTLRVNVPYFPGEVTYGETAIFWFGSISPTENYADVRVGYNSQELYLNVAAIDRAVWYDEQPSPGDLTAWDAVTLYLDVDGNQGSAPDGSSYRLTGQFSWWEPRAGYQAASRGGPGWSATSLPFESEASWEGQGPNNSNGERGWGLTYHVPFASLGLSGPPAAGEVWGLALALHDRDDGAAAPLPDRTWPAGVDFSRPASWGELAFGLPVDAPPQVAPLGTTTIRHKLNGAVVEDAAVGGTIGNMCPGEGNFIYNEWGNLNFAGAKDFNVQNQRNIADWPCFAKYYVTFPLGSLPRGKAITAATFTLHLWGNSGGGEWGDPPRSLIQVSTVAGSWDESTLTWNNAPLAKENIARAWVDPYQGEIQWPGQPYTWDVRRAVAEAYAAGQPLRLAIYSADEPLHTGKYFTASDADDWDAKGRPTLTVTWGNP